MSDCLFCRIGAGEIPAEKVYEDDRTVAFLDIHPHAPGHTVVIPKAHGELLADLSPEDTGSLLRAVQAAGGIVKRALGADGLTIGINDGAAAGQAVPHVHAHVIPRFAGDGGGSVHSIVKNPPNESVAEIAKKIKQVPST